MDEIKPQGQAEDRPQIKLDDSKSETSYSNFFLVSTSAEEFLLTFGTRSVESQTVQVRDRIILSPKNFKRTLAAMSQALKMYEERFDAIDASFAAAKEPTAQ